MKSPFSKSDSSTAVAEPPAVVDELVTLTSRRAQLQDQLATIDHTISEKTSARTAALLAGDPISGPAGVAELREEREPVASAIAVLDGQIGAIQDRRANAAQAAAKAKLAAEFGTAREIVESTQAALHAALREILFVTWPTATRAYQSAVDDARRAAAAAGIAWNPLDKWRSLVQSTVAIHLDHNSKADPRGF